MNAVSIHIGRNSRFGELPLASWEAYQHALFQEVDLVGGVRLSQTTGTGEWEGVTNDVCVLTAYVPVAQMDVLRAGLAALAGRYAQKAVGMVWRKAEDTLVLAEETPSEMGDDL